MRSEWSLVDLELLKRQPVAWVEVDFANMGRCEFKMRKGRLSSFNVRSFMQQAVRRARLSCEREGVKCPWDSDGDLLPSYAGTIAPGLAESLTSAAPTPPLAIIPVLEPVIPPSSVTSIDFSTTLEEVIADLVNSRGNQGMNRRDVLASAIDARPDTTHEAFKAALEKLFDDKTLLFKPNHIDLLVPYESVKRRGRPPGAQRKSA